MGLEQLVAPLSHMDTRERKFHKGKRPTLKEEQLGTRRGELGPDGVRGKPLRPGGDFGSPFGQDGSIPCLSDPAHCVSQPPKCRWWGLWGELEYRVRGLVCVRSVIKMK